MTPTFCFSCFDRHKNPCNTIILVIQQIGANIKSFIANHNLTLWYFYSAVNTVISVF